MAENVVYGVRLVPGGEIKPETSLREQSMLQLKVHKQTHPEAVVVVLKAHDDGTLVQPIVALETIYSFE